VLEVVAAAFAAGEPGGEDLPLSVRVEAGIPYAATVFLKAASTIAPVTLAWAVIDRA
jgi:hypothetical protein